MLTKDGRLFVAKSDSAAISLIPKMLNRHGIITGATGTGKTISLQVIAETASALGVPVFITDIKGDISGIGKAGSENPKIRERLDRLGLEAEGYAFKAAPVCFWDLFGTNGHPLRSTISEMGPMLLARILDLNDTQSGVLQLIFRIADDNGLLLLDLKDLRKIVAFVGDNRREFSQTHGNIAPATIGAIQRGLLGLEEEGGDLFFGEPALNMNDLMRRQGDMGVVNVLAADRLLRAPRVYAAFLLWLMSELYENLPEVGDPEQPKLLLFFDEAHLLFNDAPKALLERIEQVVRLIRSKGVGIFFITQNPADVPEAVLAQLGNRIQHALRAYTPGERKAVRAAAQAFRENPAFKTEDVITELGVGEALVSVLDAKGVPGIVERAWMLPPESQIGPMPQPERETAAKASELYGRYEQALDRESAYEVLSKRIDAQQAAAEQEKMAIAQAKAAAAEEKAAGRRKKEEQGLIGGIMTDFVKKTQQSVTRNIANQVGRSLIRGLLGGLLGGKR